LKVSESLDKTRAAKLVGGVCRCTCRRERDLP